MSNQSEAASLRIETDRLILRAPGPGDAKAIYQGINDFDVVSMLSRAPWPYRLEDAETFLARIPERDPATERPLSIIHRVHGLIGGCGFHSDAGTPFPELGYWLAKAHWGRGYASEATVAALKWARDGWGKRAIRASHFVENPASGRVLIKAGMLYTGVVEPLHCAARGEDMPARKLIWLA
jgi:RimJ/RimL family protein N-acetyltransferase